MRTLLFILVCFVAITSIASGALMISDPGGTVMQLSPSLLEGTPFSDFRVPGIILAALVGGVNLLAAFFNMKRSPRRYHWAMAGGILVSGWIVVQVSLIDTAHWLHFIYLGVGIIIVLTAYQLMGKALI